MFFMMISMICCNNIPLFIGENWNPWQSCELCTTQRYWLQLLKMCTSFPAFQKSPTWAGTGRSLFCDRFGILDFVFFGLKPSTLPGHSGVLLPLTEKSGVLDGLLQRGKCWLERTHGLRNSGGSQGPKPYSQSFISWLDWEGGSGKPWSNKLLRDNMS